MEEGDPILDLPFSSPNFKGLLASKKGGVGGSTGAGRERERERAFEVPISRGRHSGYSCLARGPVGRARKGTLILVTSAQRPLGPGPSNASLQLRGASASNILCRSNPGPARRHHPFSSSRIDPVMVPWATLLLLGLLFCCCLGHSSQAGAPRVYLTYKGKRGLKSFR